ncbi:MAG: hypothetical protein WCU74_02320 [Candidatus Omnitrophota bacterium]
MTPSDFRQARTGKANRITGETICGVLPLFFSAKSCQGTVIIR